MDMDYECLDPLLWTDTYASLNTLLCSHFDCYNPFALLCPLFLSIVTIPFVLTLYALRSTFKIGILNSQLSKLFFIFFLPFVTFY